MNIQLAIKEGTNVLKDQRINTAKLDAEILMAKVLKKDRKYIILNNKEDLEDKNLKYFITADFVSFESMSPLKNLTSFIGSMILISIDIILPALII